MSPLPSTAAAKPLNKSPAQVELQIEVPSDSKFGAATEHEMTSGAVTSPDIVALLAALKAAGAGPGSAETVNKHVWQTQQAIEPEQLPSGPHLPEVSKDTDIELLQPTLGSQHTSSKGWLNMGDLMDLQCYSNLQVLQSAVGDERVSDKVLLTRHEADTFAWLDGQAGPGSIREKVQAGMEAEVVKWLLASDCDQEDEPGTLQVNNVFCAKHNSHDMSPTAVTFSFRSSRTCRRLPLPKLDQPCCLVVVCRPAGSPIATQVMKSWCQWHQT
jgi:hypothetical protein